MKIESSVTVAQIDEFEDIIDVRSPSEFAHDHIPGALSHPVLDDAERARVGTIYKQVSPFDARRLGAALVARNIARHLEEAFASRPINWRPLVYCWRGGKRSGAMALVMREIGWRAATLQGGYQAFRRAVLADLDRLPAALNFRVLCGPTGSGKSELLRALAAQGAQVLDLEALANHRGSVLGGSPDGPQPSQKAFDTALWQALRHLDGESPVYVESESRKIGLVQLPTPLLERMRASLCLQIEPQQQERVRFLIAQYGHFIAQPDWLKERLQQLAPLHSREVMAQWVGLIDQGDWSGLTADLLERHYDPLYRRSMQRNFIRGDEPLLEPDSLAPEALATLAARLLRQADALVA